MTQNTPSEASEGEAPFGQKLDVASKIERFGGGLEHKQLCKAAGFGVV